MNAHATGARRVCLRAQIADIPEGGVRALPMIRAPDLIRCTRIEEIWRECATMKGMPHGRT